MLRLIDPLRGSRPSRERAPRSRPSESVVVRRTLRACRKTARSADNALRIFLRLANYFASREAVPHHLYIEPVNICNANCIFCGYQFDRRPKQVISDAHFSKAIDDYHEHRGRRIGLTPFAGEIFTDPRISDKLDYIKAKGFAHVHTYTNASLLHRFGIENVLRCGLTKLHISVPPLDARLYEAIYRNRSYNKVLSNLRDLLIAFSRIKEKTVRKVSIEFRSDRPLEQCVRLPDFREHVEPYLSEDVELGAITFFDSSTGLLKKEDLLPGMTIRQDRSSKRIPCPRIFNVQVLADGRLRLCGCRFDFAAPVDEFVIGHIQSDGIIEAFNSNRARQIIAGFHKGKCPSLCAKCAWYFI